MAKTFRSNYTRDQSPSGQIWINFLLPKYGGRAAPQNLIEIIVTKIARLIIKRNLGL